MRIPTKAFTLIEVLASTALAALLVVAVLRVSQSTAGHKRAMASVDHKPLWVGRVFDRIAWDLRHARSYAIQDDRLTLAGYGSLDDETFEPTHRPVRVEYRLRDGLLTRSQTALDAITTRSTRRELLCAGISRFELAEPAPRPHPRPRKALDDGIIGPRVAESADDKPDDQQDKRIALQAPAPDPMAWMPGLKPLHAFEVVGVTIMGGDELSASTYSRSLIVGAGP